MLFFFSDRCVPKRKLRCSTTIKELLNKISELNQSEPRTKAKWKSGVQTFHHLKNTPEYLNIGVYDQLLNKRPTGSFTDQQISLICLKNKKCVCFVFNFVKYVKIAIKFFQFVIFF